MKALLRALPDVVRLVARLATDPVLPRTAKIALAHLREFPDYYVRLAAMEREAETAAPSVP